MMPIAPLMIEHRLIERMIWLMKTELRLIEETGRIRYDFIDRAVDFIKTYADRCHHGKEEDILFKELQAKKISDLHRQVVNELIQEHIQGRALTNRIVEAKQRCMDEKQRDLPGLTEPLRVLVKFYPQHIEKEDRHFFIPCMDYFSKAEQEAMLSQFYDFDRSLFHNKYKGIVEEYEKP
ncbi:MAG TPA: cation-binding protein [Deltaproteobacteria bacterium]|nr:cation-binding protein [Deltaproteobacteria bacterium]